MRLTGKHLLLSFVSCLIFSVSQAEPLNYQAGDRLAEDIFVNDRDGSAVQLYDLLGQHPGQINVLYVFGGGDMGSGMNGHLWCQDSFEDTHILRTLHALYKDRGVNFIAVAEPPAYHVQMLGDFSPGVFFNETEDSAAWQEARQAFVSSTLAAFEDGILPVEPYFDLRLHLMLNPDERFRPPASYGEIRDWYGAFRAENDTQFYGVPNLWLLSDSGEILEAPLRGNIYHPHGSQVMINYTLADVIALIDARLESEGQ